MHRHGRHAGTEYTIAMPFPRALARFNRRVTNPLLAPVVGQLPGVGQVVHVGRRSGITHRTPVLGFRRGARVTFALTYGAGADWVRNVVAAGGCRFETARGTLQLERPRLYRDPNRRAVPWPVRVALAVLRVDEFLELSTRCPQRNPTVR
jgi:hypothetical protein